MTVGQLRKATEKLADNTIIVVFPPIEDDEQPMYDLLKIEHGEQNDCFFHAG